MQGILSDLRVAMRAWRASPGFALIAVISIAVGMGATTAVFTLLDRVLLRTMPVVRPHELVQVVGLGDYRFGSNRGDGSELSYPMYTDFRDHTETFSGMFCRVSFTFQLGLDGRSERVAGEIVSGTYFPVMGVKAAVGRTLLPEDDRTPGAHRVAVLSYRFWSARLASDPTVVGRPMVVNGHTLTIVGITEEGFDGIEIGRPAEIFVPMMMSPQVMSAAIGLDDRRYDWVKVFGRLRPGVSREQALAALQPFYRARLEAEVTEPAFVTASADARQKFLANRIDIVSAAQGRSGFRRQLSTPLSVLMAIAAGVLLIACANVAGLLLARGSARRRELAVRLALGAPRGRLVRQLFVESLLLAVVGAFGGVVAAILGAPLLLHYFVTPDLPQPISTLPDLRVLAFTGILSLVTGIVSGLVPALQSTKLDVAPTLKEHAAHVVGARGQLRKIFVAAQVAVSLLLISAAALFGQTLQNLLAVDMGFSSDRLVTASIDPSLNGYTPERNKQLAKTLLERLRATPGIASVGLSSIPLLEGNQWTSGMRVEGYVAQPDENMTQHNNAVSPGYFAAMGIPLTMGRDFDHRDERSGPAPPGRQYRAAIVNERFARQYFGSTSPLGRHVVFGFNPAIPISIEIVGVVKDAKYTDLRSDPQRQVFVPFLEQSSPRGFVLYVRTERDTSAVFQTIRQTVQQLDPDLPVYGLRAFDMKVVDSLRNERFVATMSLVSGALATIMAAIGVYGVMAFSVGQRTREIGIRIALGATVTTVGWQVVREALLIAAAGVTIGLPLTLWLGRYAASQLFGVAPTDPRTLAAASVSLIAISGLAALTPSARAARTRPITALRLD